MNAQPQTTQAGGQSLWSDARKRLAGDRLAIACLCVIVAFTLTAFCGTVIYWRYNIVNASPPRVLVPVQKLFIRVLAARSVAGREAPYQVQNLDNQYQKPSLRRQVGPKGEEWGLHPLGTDGLGRDVLLRLVQGARIAFQVGVTTALIAIPLGVILGCLAGYFGGRTDDVVVWLYSTFASMPSLLFILSISMVAGKGLKGVYLGIGLTTWVYLCRLIRGEVMKQKELTYVRAARALGMGHFRIMFRHILPNLLHLVIINFSIRFPSSIETEVIMSFLGIGVQGEPSWGLMISSARFRLWHGVWWELTFTTLAIFAVVLAFNLFGDALRDALDPRLRGQEDPG